MNTIEAIMGEVIRAEELHPDWPADPIHAVAIVCEESGEAMKAALDYVYFDKDREDIRTEIIQCAATCVRLLENWECME